MKKTIIFSFILVCLCISLFAETTKISYGYLTDGALVSVDDKGNYSGYIVAFFYELKKYEDVEIEYVPFTSSKEIHKEILSGRINLTSSEIDPYKDNLSYSISDFSELSCNVSLLALQKSSLIHCDYDAFNNITIGIITDSTGLETLSKYEQMNHFSAEHVFFDTQEEMRAALHHETIDAMVSLDIRRQPEEKNIADLKVYYFQFLTKSENSEIIKMIDKLRLEQNTLNDLFIATLKDYYFGDIVINEFSKEELDFVKNSDPLVVGYQDNYAPLSYYDKENKTDSGILIERIKEIASVSGLKIVFKPLSMKEMKTINSIDCPCDILTGVNVFKYNTPRLVSNSYYDSSIIDVQREHIHHARTDSVIVALATGTARTSEFVKMFYPNAKIVEYSTYEECFEAIQKKQADITFIEKTVGYPILSLWKYSDLMIQTSQKIPCAFRFIPSDSFISSNSNRDVINLVTVINKSIERIDDIKILENTNEDIVNIYKNITYRDFLSRYNYAIIIILFCIVAFIVINIIFIKYKSELLRNLESKNKDLKDSIVFVEKANKSKIKFLAEISHEIRTPLNAIVGLSNLLRRNIGNYDKLIENVDQIEYSSQSLLNIINDILDISAIENKKFALSNTTFDLSTTVMNIADLYYPLCMQKNVKFDLIISGFSRNLVLGDSARLTQVLNNLMSNALKYTEQGGSIEIIVNQVKIEEKRVFVQFAVKDTGCGIPENRLEQIFDPYDRSLDLNGEIEGAGLGLSITRNIVTMMQGSISVDSKEGVGSTFAVTIPFIMSDRNIEETEELIKKLSILVVDNDILCLEFFKDILVDLGVEKFDLVESGEEALDLMDKVSEKNEKYDMIFTDWKMSGIDGITVLKNSKILFGEECYGVLISAYGTNELSELAKKTQSDMFISKPIQSNQIKSVLMQYAKERFVQKPMTVSDYDFTGRKVLVVDNNKLNLKVEESLLEVVGIETVCVEGGQEAYDAFVASEPGTFDLILMDIQMPRVDGLESTRMIRKSTHKEATTIPIIAITAYAFTENISASFAAGMNDHLSKPVSALELYETLAKYL